LLKVAVLGAAGRMGRAVLGCIVESDDLRLAGAITEPNDRLLGRDAGELIGGEALGVPLTDDPRQGLDGAQAAVDFTLPTAAEANLRACVESGSALVIGTTGLEERQLKAMERAAHEIPIVYARNMSVGVNVFMELVARAAKALGDGYDVEIVETHHRFKKDAPSGTALRMAEVVAQALGRDLAKTAVYDRHDRLVERTRKEIGMAALRSGDVVGEHTVSFGALGERLELTHRAQSRDNFARGALRAARFIATAQPGLYSMQDVLGLT